MTHLQTHPTKYPKRNEKKKNKKKTTSIDLFFFFIDITKCLALR